MYDHFRHKFTAFVLGWLILSYLVTDNWSQFSVSIMIAAVAFVGFHFWKKPRPLPLDDPLQSDYRIDFTIKPYKSLLGAQGFDLIVHSRFRNDFVAAARKLGANDYTFTKNYAPLTYFTTPHIIEKSIEALLQHHENLFRVRTYQEAMQIQQDIEKVITNLKSQILVAGSLTQGHAQRQRLEG